MSIFVDTSAIYALLDADDANHAAARSAFAGFLEAALTTHAYVVVESVALVSRRLGREAMAHFIDNLLPVIDVEMVDAGLHAIALASFREGRMTGVSFVDRTSFVYMRQHGIDTAFAVDRDFRTAGFSVVPTPTD